MPSNVIFLYSILINFVTFNIVPTDGIYANMFNFTETPSKNEKFESLDIF